MDLFPLGIATGRAFCNRKRERALLADNVLAGRHSWLMAPRRYGKTSLIQQVLLDLGRKRKPRVRSATVDLLITYDLQSVQDRVLEGIARLVGELMPLRQKTLASITRFFGSLKPEITLSSAGASVRFVTVRGRPEHIVEALTGLDRLAGEQNARAVLVLDEFQQLASVRDSQPLEGAMRHAIERARSVTYLLSGSHRHMLQRMFEDRSRPLYQLCERVELGRIDAGDYAAFLHDAAKLKWSRELGAAAIDAILAVTERHPYYINRLCGTLWRERAAPGPARVQAAWSDYVIAERVRIASELRDLSPNQRALLAALAEQPTAQPRAREFLDRTRVASASAGQAIEALLEKDLLLREEDGLLQIMDPSIAWYLRQ